MRTALIAVCLAALALLGGCASAPQRDDHCVLPVTRDAGMGVRVDGCAAWSFGPTRLQRAEFDRRAGRR